MSQRRVIATAIVLLVIIGALFQSSSASTTAPAYRDVRTLARDLRNPEGVAVDVRTRSVYVSDTKSHQVRKIQNGVVTILAGSGTPGLKDGSGAAAQFKEPKALVLDPIRNVLYVADSANHVIRRLSLDGVVTTFAGTGTPGFRDGAVNIAELKEPSGVTVDAAGNVYVADTKNNRVRRISPEGVVTTFAGSGRDGFEDGAAAAARFAEPEGLTASPTGAIYVADTRNHRIRKIEQGVVSTVAGTGQPGYVDGPASDARFSSPVGMVLDPGGNLIIADSGNDVIRALTLDHLVMTVAGRPATNSMKELIDGPALAARFSNPRGLAFAGALFIADSGNDALRVATVDLRLSAVEPNRGPVAGGNELRLTGGGFAAGQTRVSVGGVEIDEDEVVHVSSSELVAVAPPHPEGTVDVIVSTPAGSVTLEDAYTYLTPPSIVSISPARGTTAGGEVVTILGSGFDGDTEFFFGSAAALNPIVSDAASVSVMTPPGTHGAVDVIVRSAGGEATLAGGFRYWDAPLISGFTPASGAAGTAVTIGGARFDPEPNGNVVRFGALNATIVDATESAITAIVPAGAQTARISVATAGGVATAAADFVVPVLTALSITPVTANLNPAATLQLNATATYSDGRTEPLEALAWSSDNHDVATVNATGLVTAAGSGQATITATTAGLTAAATITVADSSAPPPDPSTIAPKVNKTIVTSVFDATAFLYTGPGAIQSGVAPGTIQRHRASVLRGRVLARDGQPLSGVRVTIAGHPEYGRTTSRLDGLFDLAVNGGGHLSVQYDRPGYITAQRQVRTSWLEYEPVPDVVLVAYDTVATQVVMQSSEMQVARGSRVTDQDGERQAALFIPAGTGASMTLPDGSVRELASVTVRATEFSVGARGPEAMPAALPPQSGYTYCVELSADEAVAAGATTVTFTKPLALYVDNFLGFPVGGVVPAGYYDRTRRVWVPSENGRVVKVLATGGGVASIDLDGDGAADGPEALAASGISAAELRDVASSYAEGATLWRVPVSHFTPWDCNWPYGPPAGAQPPSVPSPVTDAQVDHPSCQTGSLIECETQTLGESIPLAGSALSLQYRSDRTAGRQANRMVQVALTGGTVPAAVKEVTLEIDVAGTTIQQTFSATPDQRYTFSWDGRDAYGRVVQGGQALDVRIGYVYDAVYQTPATFAQSFGAFSGVPMTGNRARQDVTLWQESRIRVGGWDSNGLRLGGWNLSAHHTYDHFGQTLLRGNGNRRSLQSTGATLRTTNSGAGAFAVAADGALYVAQGPLIVRIAPDGVTIPVAGKTAPGYSGDGGPATLATLDYVSALDVGPDDALYILEQSYRVRRIGTDGIITTIAGTGTAGYSGDGGPAIQARIDAMGMTVAADGTVYLAEPGNNRVRAITTSGLIYAAAGSGEHGAGGDDGPASHSTFENPVSVAAGPDGSVYINDWYNLKLRRIGPDGVMSTAAGTGWDPGSTQDGVPATQAQIDYCRDTAVGPDGSIYVGAYGQQRVKRIDPNGTITTLAGGGNGAEGSRATAMLVMPDEMAFGPDGNVYVKSNGVVKRLSPSQPGAPATPVRSDLTVTSDDGEELYIFSDEGRHLRTADAYTGATLYSFTYDAVGLLTAVADAFGRITTIERDAAGNATAIVSPTGVRTTLQIGGDGYLASVTNPAGETSRYTYSAAGLMRTYRSGRDAEHKFEYDAAGLLIKDTNAAGAAKTLGATRTSDGATVSVTSASGTQSYTFEILPSRNIRRVLRDAAGLETTMIEKTDGGTTAVLPDGTTVTRQTGADPRYGSQAPFAKIEETVTPNWLWRTVSESRQVTMANALDPRSIRTETRNTSVNGRAYVSVFDVANRTVTNTTPAGRRSTVTVDQFRRATRRVIPGLAPMLTSYDANGNVGSFTIGTRTSSFTYDDDGNLLTATDPLSRTITLAYDGADRVTRQTFADGRYVAFAYDAAGNLTSITPPGRPAHRFAIGANDLPESYTAPDGAVTRFAYDGDRRLTSTTFPDGTSATLGYNTTGYLTSVTGDLVSRQYGYHSASGLVSSISVADGSSLAYSFDGSLLTGMTWSGAVSGSVGFAYDNDFRVTRQSVNGSNITFGYDRDSFLTSAGALTLVRDSRNGMVTGSTVGGVTDSYTYNDVGELTAYNATFNGTAIASFTYTRDDGGRVTQQTATLAGTSSAHDYAYDTAGRLALASVDGAGATYGYDTNGNRTLVAAGDRNTSASYDSQDRLLTHGDTTYTYTAKGELLTKTTAAAETTTYRHDGLGNLRSVTTGNRLIEYAIDGQSRRVGRKVDGALTHAWLYSGPLTIAAELDATGAVVSRFVYASRANIPDYIIKGGATYRIIADHLGSPRMVVNVASGALVQKMTFDAWGNVLQDTNPGFHPFGFAGGLYDSATGLVHFGARDYDPRTGRWTAEDPVGFSGGSPNLYTYAANDPVNFIDPSGYDNVTADPHVREMIEKLWSDVGYGGQRYEVFAFIKRDAQGNYSCERLRGTFESNKFTIKKGTPIPPDTIAVIHTHPRGRTDSPAQGSDPAAAQAFGMPLYVITTKGVGKFDPALRKQRGYRGTQEETTNNWSGNDIANDGCGCPVQK